jgi:hypothetical protein
MVREVSSIGPVNKVNLNVRKCLTSAMPVENSVRRSGKGQDHRSVTFYPFDDPDRYIMPILRKLKLFTLDRARIDK